MTPDAQTQLELVNATATGLYVSSNPPPSVPSFNAYQMQSWFTFPNGMPAPIVASGGVLPNNSIQFQRGVGDEDDAADLVVSAGSANGSNLFHLYAGSTSTSGHYLEVIPLAAGSSLVVGVAPSSLFENATPASVAWSPITTGSANVPLNLQQPGVPAPQALVIADLSILFDSATATALFTAIANGTVTTEDQDILYANVAGYCFPAMTTLSYQLTQVDFVNPPPPTTGSTALVGETTITTTTASAEQQITLDQTLTDTFSLTSTQTWAVGAEVQFDIPLSFLPGATISGSFESADGEMSEVSQTASFGTATTVTLPNPGTYNITATALIADNYVAPFTGTLQVTGFATVPGNPNIPLSGTLLATLLSSSAPRNTGFNAGPVTAGVDMATAPVSGTLTGTFAYDLEITETPVPTGA